MASSSKNIFWLALSRALAVVLLFLAYTQLLRYLGPYTFGQHQFVLSYITIFGVVVDFGIQQYITKRMSEDPDNVKRYFQHFLAVELLLALAIYASLLLIAFSSGYDHIVLAAIAVAGFGMAIHALTYPFLAVMTAFGDLKKVAALNFLSSGINLAIITLTIVFDRSIVFLVTNQIIYAILALIFYYRFVKRYIPEPNVRQALKRLDSKLVRHMLRAALPFALLVGFSTIYNRIDMVLISRMLGFEQNGLYGTAYRFFDLLAFFPAVVSHTLYPVFAGLMAKQALSEVRETIQKYLRFQIALALPIAVAIMILSKHIIALVAGAQYADSASALSVLIWASAALYIYIVVNSLVISQLTKWAVIVTGGNVALNIAGNLILLPRIGILGAAIMTVVSEAIQGIFYFYLARKRIVSFPVFSLFWKPLVASLLMGVVLWSLRDRTIYVLVPVGGAAYVVALALLKFFQKGDIDLVKKIFGRQAAT